MSKETVLQKLREDRNKVSKAIEAMEAAKAVVAETGVAGAYHFASRSIDELEKALKEYEDKIRGLE